MKSTPKNPGSAPRTTSSGRPPARPSSVRATASTPAARAARTRAAEDFVRGVVSEMKRVTWPSREEWVAATILTIVLVVGVGVFTYVIDLAFGWIFTLLTGGAR